MLSTTNYDIVAMAETWWDSDTTTALATAGTHYTCMHRNRGSKGGGVAVFIHKKFGPKLVQEWRTNEHFEAISISLSNDTFLLSVVYWPPSRQADFIHEAQEFIQYHAQSAHKHKIIVGDLNLTGITWEVSEDAEIALEPIIDDARPFERDLIALLSDSSLDQVNVVANENGRFLDLFITNQPENVTLNTEIELHQVLTYSRHHRPVAFEYRTNHALDHPDEAETRSYIDHKKLGQMLENLRDQSVNDVASAEELAAAINKAFTVSTVVLNMRAFKWSASHPWLRQSPAYGRLRNQIIQAKKSGECRKNVEKLRRKLKTEYDKAKKAYFDKVVKSLSGNKKELYDVLRYKKLNSDTFPLHMTYNGQSIHPDERFSNMSTHLKSAFTGADPDLYDGVISDNIRNLWTQSYVQSDADWSTFNNFTESEIEQQIAKLDVKKSPGPLGQPSHVFKTHQSHFAKLLAKLYSFCGTNKWIPEAWKISFMTPVPKKGSPAEIANYRGIALTSVLPKLFDAVITEKLYDILGDGISQSQHGFRRNKGTATCLLEVAQYISTNRSPTTRIDAVFIDYAKAFDRVSHAVLVRKLAKKGVPIDVLGTIMLLVLERKFQLKIGKTTSQEIFSPRSSVPQGSHIGPLLFIVLCDDLPAALNSTVAIYQYADDVVVLKSVRSVDDTRELQQNIDILASWSEANRLTVNTNKTVFMQFGGSKIRWHPQYTIYSAQITEVLQMNYLGVLLDAKLTFNMHVQQLSIRSIKLANAAARLSRYIGKRALNLSLYQLYNDPTVNYASGVWYRGKGIHRKAISEAHKRATRAALSTPFRPHIAGYMDYQSRCSRLNVVTADQRMEALSTMFAFKIFTGMSQSTCSGIMRQHLSVPRERGRHFRTIFNPRNPIQHTPLGYLMKLLDKNLTEEHINNKSITTIKRIIAAKINENTTR